MEKKCTVPTGPVFLFFPTFQGFSCFPVFFPCFLLFILFFFCLFVCFLSSKTFGFSGVFLLKVFKDPGKPRKPWKINQFYQSQGKVMDFFYTEGCVHILMIIFFFLIYFLAYFLYVYLIEKSCFKALFGCFTFTSFFG